MFLKMMSIKVAFLVASVCVLVRAQDLSAANIQTLMGYHNECKAETNIDDGLVSGLMAGNFPDDPVLKQHLFCMSKKLGIQDDSGEIQKDAVRAKISKLVQDEARIDELTETCSVEKGTAEDTAFEITKCVYEGTH